MYNLFLNVLSIFINKQYINHTVSVHNFYFIQFFLVNYDKLFTIISRKLLIVAPTLFLVLDCNNEKINIC